MNSDWRKPLFYVSALYDGLLGLAFFLCDASIFEYFHVTPPNHPGYVKFPALLLIIFGLLFLKIARDPEANRDLIIYGILLKIAYAGLVFWYHFTTGIPAMWMWCAYIDTVFLILFIVAQRKRVATVRTA
jgi:hypothetical protein